MPTVTTAVILLFTIFQENIRKTKTKRNTRNPVYSEEFRYKNVESSDLLHKTLEVSVVDKKVIYPLKQAMIEKITVDLSSMLISDTEDISWYQLIKL